MKTATKLRRTKRPKAPGERYPAIRLIEIDRIHLGTQRDAVLFATGANASHGLRRTNQDKRHAVMTLLNDAEWSQWSDRRIAEQAAVSHPLVMQLRSQVVTVTTSPASKAADQPRLGKDGKSYKVQNKAPQQAREPGEDAAEPEHVESNGAYRDAFGPVHHSLNAVFVHVPTFRGIKNRLGTLQNDIEELQRSDAGAEHRSAGSWRRFSRLFFRRCSTTPSEGSSTSIVSIVKSLSRIRMPSKSPFAGKRFCGCSRGPDMRVQTSLNLGVYLPSKAKSLDRETAIVTRTAVTVTAVCRRCRQPFRSTRRSRKFCSAACRQAGYRKRRKQSVHFRSDTPEWETPQELFAELDREFHFKLDVCATPENAKCQRYFTKLEDGLAQHWDGVCWMNPPYGRQIARWVRKALEESWRGAIVVCLVPARTDTTWWHLAAENGAEIRFLRGRLRFGGMAQNAPFPSALVIFRPLRIVEGAAQ